MLWHNGRVSLIKTKCIICDQKGNLMKQNRNPLKRILAMAGVVLLLGIYIAAFICAMIRNEAAQSLFRAALGCTILVPVLLYLILMVARVIRPQKSGLIDAVVFDLGKVLLDFPWETYTGENELSPEVRDVLLEKVVPSPLWHEFDVNLRPYEEIVEEFTRLDPRYSEEIRNLILTEDRIITPFWYTGDLVRGLKRAGYRVYYLSNWTKEWYEHLTENGVMDFLKNMDGGVFSFDVHIAKPDPAIYQILLKKYQLDPGRCLFIDDSQANVDQARKEGMSAFLFTDYTDMTEKLSSLGIRF